MLIQLILFCVVAALLAALIQRGSEPRCAKCETRKAAPRARLCTKCYYETLDVN